MTASPIEALKGGFRRACVRRLVGDEQGAVAVLRDEIPKLVISWSKTTSLEAAEKKAKLKEIFEYCSEWELNIIRLKSLDLPTFNLGVSLRKTDVN